MSQADPPSWLTRTWWMVAGLMLVVWSLRLSASVTVFPFVSAVSAVTGLWGLTVGVAAWLPRWDPARWRWTAWVTVLAALLAFGVWAYLQIYANPGYGTDEMAFDQYAASLFVHGINPYLHSMAPAIARYHVSPDGFTYRLNGQPVTALSYPALAFLFYTPLLAAGWSTQAAAIVNVAAWIAAVVVLFAVVPRALRPVAIVLGSASIFVSYAAGGVTDALFVPFLIGALVSWDRYATARGWHGWLSPVLMGMAMAVKQTPWFILVFLLTAIVLERRHLCGSWRGGLGRSARYLAISVVAFLLPNLWFIAMSPAAWLRGVLAPFGGHVVPAGQGLVDVSLTLGVGGGSLAAYTVAATLVMVALLVTEAASWPALRSSFVLLSSLVLFFATRSLGSYLVELFPAALAAAVTVKPITSVSRQRRFETSPFPAAGNQASSAPEQVPRSRAAWRYAAVAACSALAAAGVAGALFSPSPLAMRIVGVHTTGQLSTVDWVAVHVLNRSGGPARPHFSVELGGVLTTFWHAGGGPAVLGPGRSATYTLLAPNTPAMPPVAGGFEVIGFTKGPDTVSRTGAYLPTRDHLVVSPDALSTPVVAGRSVVIRAELFDPLDQPIHRAGVPVYLGQIIYSQAGPRAPSTTINGSLPGQTRVMALTDRRGVATFAIHATAASAAPVDFQANLVDSKDHYPYGYSPILMIYFVKGTS
jgi:uncharacterized membrane protein